MVSNPPLPHLICLLPRHVLTVTHKDVWWAVREIKKGPVTLLSLVLIKQTEAEGRCQRAGSSTLTETPLRP